MDSKRLMVTDMILQFLRLHGVKGHPQHTEAINEAGGRPHVDPAVVWLLLNYFWRLWQDIKFW